MKRTPLIAASRNGHIDCCRLLIERRADVNLPRTDNGTTAVYEAAQEGHAHVLKYLLSLGALVEGVVPCARKGGANTSGTDGHPNTPAVPPWGAVGGGGDAAGEAVVDEDADVDADDDHHDHQSSTPSSSNDFSGAIYVASATGKSYSCHSWNQ